jgi:2-polyprenyl-6-methoxyphenol hydroxylase-like FAD-dependent oxidoreductase
MAFGRALLLGDAAFVPRPHTAGDAAKAAADAPGLASRCSVPPSRRHPRPSAVAG